jgi:hemerythrin
MSNQWRLSMGVRLTQWTKNLKTDHKDIDEQHQDLFKRFDAFISATLKNEGHKKANNLLSFLAEYTNEHFSYEETYYKSKNYPKVSEHIKEHDEFTQNLRLIKRAYHNERGKIDAKKLNEMLGEWFRGHIQESDIGATSWIKENPTPFHFEPAKLKNEARQLVK